ncbi:hypothetical protein ABVY78_004525 [Vibrio parahaemolyticus]
MSDYYFAREIVETPLYDFPDELSDSVPSNVFTYPNQPIPLVKRFAPTEGYKITDVFLIPSLVIRSDVFESIYFNNLFGVNWVDITLVDNGNHAYKMLQLCNEINVIDRDKSDFDFYDEFEGGEFISGMNRLVVNDDLIDSIEVEKRLIFRDSGWKDKIFYHKSIMEMFLEQKVQGIEFFSVDDYSEFV